MKRYSASILPTVHIHGILHKIDFKCSTFCNVFSSVKEEANNSDSKLFGKNLGEEKKNFNLTLKLPHNVND